ncbi:MAG TPA: hypothetical protein VHF23_09030 [Gaiellaceae bacterium]|nr:hypothetical protein [Gaiellaceae bacterium]
MIVEAAALLLAALLTAALVVYVARPFLRAGEREHDVAEDGGEAAERLRLLEERDRALAALKELEFDHRTGKVSDADYRALVGPLRREAGEALRALERAAEPERERPRADVRG